LKALFAIVLVMLLLVQSFYHTMLVVNYALNRAEITREFCLNKSNPSRQCNGKCHLAKELKKADQADKKLPTPLKEKFEMLQICVAFPTFFFIKPTVSTSDFHTYRNRKYLPPDFGIFHPPRFFV
jgi:hypothetical protein